MANEETLEKMKENVEQNLGQLFSENVQTTKVIEGEESSVQAESQPPASKCYEDLIAKSSVEGKGNANEQNEDASSSSKVEDRGKDKAVEDDDEETQLPLPAPKLALQPTSGVRIRLMNGRGESSWAIQNTPQAFSLEEQAFNERYAMDYYRNEYLAQTPAALDIGESSTAVVPPITNTKETDDPSLGVPSLTIPPAHSRSATILEDEAEEDDDSSSIITNPYNDANLRTTPGYSCEMGLLRHVMHRPICPSLLAPSIGAIGKPRPDPDFREQEDIIEVLGLRYPHPSVPRLSSGRVEAGRRAMSDLLARIRGSKDTKQENPNTPPAAPEPKKKSGPPPNAPKEPKAMREQRMGSFTYSGSNALAFQTRSSAGRPGPSGMGQRPTQSGTSRKFAGPSAQHSHSHRAPSSMGQRPTQAGTSRSSSTRERREAEASRAARSRDWNKDKKAKKAKKDDAERV